MSNRWVEEPRYEASRNRPRPLLLGYIRAEVLASGTELPDVEADLQAFADREEFGLGTIYVEGGSSPGAFHALLAEVRRNEAAWGFVVPDLRHVTDEEHLVLRRHQEDCVKTAVLVANFSPRSGGPGAVSPLSARSATPRRRAMLRSGVACATAVVPWSVDKAW
jgi:hypothetical protein